MPSESYKGPSLLEGTVMCVKQPKVLKGVLKVSGDIACVFSASANSFLRTPSKV